MADPLGDAIKVLSFLKKEHPDLNRICRFGTLTLTFKDGVLYSIGPLPYMVRGKDFHVENGT